MLFDLLCHHHSLTIQMDQKITQLKKLYTRDENGKIHFVSDFMANGTKYNIADSMSMDYWTLMQKKQTELAWGVELKSMMDCFRRIWDAANNQQFSSVVIEAYNMMNGVVALDENRTPIAVELCKLFIYAEGEDPRFVDPKMLKKKDYDWRQEGIDMQSFFYLAIGSIPNFTPVYENIIQDISQLREMKVVMNPVE